MRFSPGCNCCMTWGWEARRSFSDCKKFQHITYLKDDDRIEKVYDCDVVVIGQRICDVPRPDLDEDQLDTVRDYLEKGGKVIALGEYKGVSAAKSVTSLTMPWNDSARRVRCSRLRAATALATKGLRTTLGSVNSIRLSASWPTTTGSSTPVRIRSPEEHGGPRLRMACSTMATLTLKTIR